jgi:N-acetylglucosaminyl-diphospho-decaprenol L-rhamnosyltransferase
MAGSEGHLVSIVIPTWNQRDLLTECLESILRYTSSLDTEIIVVDDASTDGTAELIKKKFPNVRLIENRQNEGYAKAVNKGVDHSKGNFIFLLNNDTRFVGNTIDVLYEFLMEHKDVGAVAPLLVYPDGRLQVSCRRFPTPAALLFEKIRMNGFWSFRRWKLTLEEHLKGGSVPQPMASAILIKRDCWDAVGAFDERFPIFFNDVDWCYRLYKNTSYKIFLIPSVKVIHYCGASVDTLGLRKKLEFYKGLIRFYLKHFLFKDEIIKEK